LFIFKTDFSKKIELPLRIKKEVSIEKIWKHGSHANSDKKLE